MGKVVIHTDNQYRVLKSVNKDFSIYNFYCHVLEYKKRSCKPYVILDDLKYQFCYVVKSHSEKYFDRLITQLRNRGWLWQTKNNGVWSLKSKKRVWAEYGIENVGRLVTLKDGRKKFYTNKTVLRADSKKDLYAIALYILLKRKLAFVFLNEYASNVKLDKKKKKSIVSQRLLSFSSDYRNGSFSMLGMSAREAARLLGFNSAQSGTNYLKYMVQKGWIKMKKHFRSAGHEYDALQIYDRDFLYHNSFFDSESNELVVRMRNEYCLA